MEWYLSRVNQGIINKIEPSSVMLPVPVCALTHLRSLEFPIDDSKICSAGRRASNMPAALRRITEQFPLIPLSFASFRP